MHSAHFAAPSLAQRRRRLVDLRVVVRTSGSRAGVHGGDTRERRTRGRRRHRRWSLSRTAHAIHAAASVSRCARPLARCEQSARAGRECGAASRTGCRPSRTKQHTSHVCVALAPRGTPARAGSMSDGGGSFRGGGGSSGQLAGSGSMRGGSIRAPQSAGSFRGAAVLQRQAASDRPVTRPDMCGRDQFTARACQPPPV